MNMQEWHKLTNWNPNGAQAEAEWETIHTVYQWHPAIPGQGGKQVLAGLYKIGGLGLMRDMETAARAELAAEEAIREAEQEVREQEEKVKFEQACLLTRKEHVARLQRERRARHASYADQGFADQAPAPKRAA